MPHPRQTRALPKEIQSQESRDPAAQDASDSKLESQIRAQVRTLAERALINDPLNARALRILGLLSVQASDDKQAESFMHAAVRRSLFETEAVYWMMQKTYADKNYHATLGYADTLLRTSQRTLSYVMPMLGKLAENQHAAGELRQLLASNPAWREGFFSHLSGSISDARTPLVIFLGLKDTAAPPTTAELRSYLNFLVDRKFYDLAYYTWLQFMPAEQLNKVGNLFNGSFEIVPSGLPFDWVWTEKSGVTIQFALRPDRKVEHGLYIELGPGRVDFPNLTQLIMLSPGSYHFQGEYKSALVGQRGLQWRITCAGGQGGALGESPLVAGADSAWRDFEFSFSVPDADCPAQNVTLASGARSASEQFLSGTIWYDDLKIINESVIAPLKKPL